MFKFLPLLCILLQPFCFAKYYSQCDQDKYVNETFFKDVENGVFVDIGAYDGKIISNTYFFETERNWTGICFEPNPVAYDKLERNRNCLCIQGCVSPEHNATKEFLSITGGPEVLSGLKDQYDRRHTQRIRREMDAIGGVRKIIKVRCYNLNRVLAEHGIDHVHFLSIDTEGGELEILKSIDFNKCQIDVITVENNYNDPRFVPLMQSRGFKFVKQLEQDQVFVNKNFKRFARN